MRVREREVCVCAFYECVKMNEVMIVQGVPETGKLLVMAKDQAHQP